METKKQTKLSSFFVIHRVHNITSSFIRIRVANQSYGHPLKPDCPYKGGSTVCGVCAGGLYQNLTGLYIKPHNLECSILFNSYYFSCTLKLRVTMYTL